MEALRRYNLCKWMQQKIIMLYLYLHSAFNSVPISYHLNLRTTLAWIIMPISWMRTQGSEKLVPDEVTAVLGGRSLLSLGVWQLSAPALSHSPFPGPHHSAKWKAVGMETKPGNWPPKVLGPVALKGSRRRRVTQMALSKPHGMPSSALAAARWLQSKGNEIYSSAHRHLKPSWGNWTDFHN